jgi:hypothetical protein
MPGMRRVNSEAYFTYVEEANNEANKDSAFI